MSKDNINNIFVSHYHSDAEHIEGMKNLLKKKNTEARDSSIYEAKAKNNANNPDYIKSLIRPQIQWAGTVVVLIGPKTSSSDWVNWEIEYAAEKGKRIVGVYLRGATESDIPEALKKNGDALVAWNADKISRAVNGEDIWEGSDGAPTNGTSSGMSRSTC